MLTIASAIADAEWVYELWLCTKNTSRALIERPYSCAPQAVGAVYDRPGFFVQSPSHPWQTADINMQKMFRFTMQTFRRKIRTLRESPRIFQFALEYLF